MKRTTWGCRVLAFAAVLSMALQHTAVAQTGAPDGQWPNYAGDKGSTKYAALDQINRNNVSRLQEAWRWEANQVYPEIRGDGYLKITPIVVDGVMYTSTPFFQVVTIDPGTGETIWALLVSVVVNNRRSSSVFGCQSNGYLPPSARSILSESP